MPLPPMTDQRQFAVVILAAGQGTRMRSDTHKVLHPIASRPLLLHLLDRVDALGADKRVVVVGKGRDQVEVALAGRDVAIAHQAEQKGTGHAVQQAADALAGYDGAVLILYGDTPFVEAETLERMLDRLDGDGGPGVVNLAAAEGREAVVIEGDPYETAGVNSRAELAHLELEWQRRRREEVLDEGATLIDPESVWFAFDTKLARDVTVEPHVVFGPGVPVADGATIHAFSHIEGAVIGSKASIGPFARIRPGTRLGERTKVGNFVELKKAEVGEGAKVNHLSYVGDAVIGAGANIGAGTITCNYDGFGKYRTVIGARAFIGSNTALVAPVTIGDGAVVGAGSVITEDVEADSLAIERGEQKGIAGWAKRFRERMTRKAAE